MFENVKAYSDIFIKYLFSSPGNEDLTMDFINNVLLNSNFPLISSVRILNPFSIQNFRGDKMIIVDLEVTDDRGRIFNIEVQSSSHTGYKHRALYYWSKLYSEQISEGDGYTLLKPAMSINILNFDLIPSFDYYHSWFLLTHNIKKDLVLTDHLVIHFLELTKLPQSFFESFNNDDLFKWLYFFKYRDKEDFNMKLVVKDDAIEKANNVYERFNQDRKLRKIYDAYIKQERDYNTEIQNAKKDGEKIGIKKGEEIGIKKGEEIGIKKGEEMGIKKGEEMGIKKGEHQKAMDTAKIMKDWGMEVSKIAEATGLKIKEIKDL